MPNPLFYGEPCRDRTDNLLIMSHIFPLSRPFTKLNKSLDIPMNKHYFTFTMMAYETSNFRGKVGTEWGLDHSNEH
jgi:hypothetical protein